MQLRCALILVQKMPTNLLNIDSMVEQFLDSHAAGIATMNKMYFSESSDLSNRALAEELKNELRTGCVTYLNKIDAEEDGLPSYLFYIANAYCKNKASAVQVKKKTSYLCPGCLVLGTENVIEYHDKIFKCHECYQELTTSKDPKLISFYRAFFKHSKIGYHCDECDRFIPHPLDDSPMVSCPYLDCSYVGPWASLKRMHHPSTSSNAEMCTLDADQSNGISFKNAVVDSTPIADIQIIDEQELVSKLIMLNDIIDDQKNSIPYNSSDATVKHKLFCYQAFQNILKQYPEEMKEYLLENSRSGGFQCKIFQEYISLLEKALPYSYKKSNKHYLVETLLDSNLNLFDGLSEFDAIISDKLEIKNGTKEFYIGGRKGSISQPYYIGKLLSINNKKTKEPLLGKVKEYTFSKIKMKDIVPGTEVIVTHLRVPPHYQMGGMVYVNRLRKKIVERAKYLINKDSNEA